MKINESNLTPAFLLLLPLLSYIFYTASQE